jgi:HEAT repeat protein
MSLSDASGRRTLRRGPRVVRRAVVIALLAGLSVCGCVHPREPVRFDSPDVNARIAAIRRAARTGDRSAAPHLVLALDDDDPAVRFYAIEALRRLAGERMGYDYYEDDPDARQPAVQRWRQWVVGQGMTMPSESTTSAPATQASTPRH